MLEIRHCSNYPGYYIDNEGNLYNKRMKKLALQPMQDGYLRATVYINKERKYVRISRLVMYEFNYQKDFDMLLVEHIDGDKANNCLSNLRYRYLTNNVAHSIEKGYRTKVGNAAGTFKILSKKDIEDIKEYHKFGYSHKWIAEHIGCSRRTVQRYINNTYKRKAFLIEGDNKND